MTITAQPITEALWRRIPTRYLVKSNNPKHPGREYEVNAQTERCECRATKRCYHIELAREFVDLYRWLKRNEARVVRCGCGGTYSGHEYTCKPTQSELVRARFEEQRLVVVPIRAERWGR